MSTKTRQYDELVTKVLTSHGAEVLERGSDGAGHRTVTFSYRGRRSTFHYAHTGISSGRGLENTKSRLRWALRSIPLPAPGTEPAPPEPEPAPVVSLPNVELERPPMPAKLTRSRRKEIAKRYLSVTTLEAIMSEFDLSEPVARTLILGQRGQAADKLKRELNLKRAEEAKRLRAVMSPPPAPVASHTTVHHTQRQAPTQALRTPDKRRDRRLFLFYYYGMPLRTVAEVFGVPLDEAHRIACRERNRDNREQRR